MIDPLVFGDYPEIVKRNVGTRLPAFTGEESERVKGSFDFIGLNHYYTVSVKDNPSILGLHRGLFTDVAADFICKNSYRC